MQNITTKAFAVLFTMILGMGLVQAEGDAQAGKQKNAMCQGCHGIEGFQVAYPKVYSVPLIGGQSKDYIEAALKAYRSGDRVNETMHAIAADLSDQDISDLAAFYSASK